MPEQSQIGVPLRTAARTFDFEPPDDAAQIFKSNPVNLEALFTGGDPFAAFSTSEDSQSDEDIASSKPNDFKDFGEQ